MTTHPRTSSSPSGSPDFRPDAGTGTSGLPDVATLARLANEYFAARPVPSASAGVPDGGSAPSADQTAPSAVPTPGLPPVPDLPFVPEPVAVLPANPDPPSGPFGAAAPSTPYYFLTEASTAPLTGSPAIGPGVLAEYGLPGEAELLALLAVVEAPSPGAQLSPAREVNAPGQLPAWSDTADRDVASAQLDRHPAFDVMSVRRDFPILGERVNGRQLVWFDNAATTQKPRSVINRLSYYYEHENSNIHRAAHELAARSTDAYESARDKVARFIGASSAEEIVFLRGTTEAINLVAQTWGRKHLGAGDEMVITHLEHHANIVPWQMLAADTGVVIRVAPVDHDGQILLEEYSKLLNDRTKLVSFAHVSNALGTVTPARQMIELAQRAGALTLLDAAQSVSHLPTNVQDLDADFLVLSGHKIYGPTGIGVLYGKAAVLADIPPWQGGGNMIRDVTLERSTFQEPPGRFEAGTGNIADAIGLGAALDYLQRLGMDNVAQYEHDLLRYATARMCEVPGLRLIGTAPDKASVLSFVLAGYRPDEVGQALNREGIAVRSGHHCAQPILRRFGLEATVRPSLALYNTGDEVDHMVAVLHRLAGEIGRGARTR